LDNFGSLIEKKDFVWAPQAVESQPQASESSVAQSQETQHLVDDRSINAARQRPSSTSNLPRTPKRRQVNSSRVGVLVCNNGKRRLYPLPPSLRSTGRSLGRKSRKSLVNQVIKDTRMKGMVLKKVGAILRKEQKQLCGLNSCFSKKNVTALETFTWSHFITQLKANAPSLFTVLAESVEKTGLKKDIAIVFCAALLVRSHSSRANIVQRMMSLLLYASHAPKQVLLLH
jgi:hypothetical protein